MSSIAELQGEQGRHEVNGGDRNYTRFERLIIAAQSVLKVLFLIAAPFVISWAIGQGWQ